VFIDRGCTVVAQPLVALTPIKLPHEKFADLSVPNSTASAKSIYPESDAEKVADACQQIGKFRDTKGAGQSEPLWFDCLGIVGHCEKGAAICHDWSSRHSGYDAGETERKYLYRIRTAPTTCNQFRKTNPAGCEGCLQTCHSPITLGWEYQDPLMAMQQQFALLNLEGKLFQVDVASLNERSEQGLAKRLEMSPLTDGRLLIARALKAQFPQADVAKITAVFVISPQTKCYSGVEFNPNGHSGDSLNLWVGPTIQPKLGQWGLIQEFLLDIICNKDQVAYHYLLKYMAHALQYPEEKPGVLIILVSGQ
jgi:hypothetical protein